MGVLTWFYTGTQLASTPCAGAHIHAHIRWWARADPNPPIFVHNPHTGHKATEEGGIPVPAGP